MRPTVHILAIVRKPELLNAALLVFKTLRIGFPTARVMVWGGNLDSQATRAVFAAAYNIGADYRNISGLLPGMHESMIERLLMTASSPFWVCDTDVVFFEPVESFALPEGGLFTGRYQPAFHCSVTGCEHVERLHPCVMWFNPVALRQRIAAWMTRVDGPSADIVQHPLVRSYLVPLAGRRLYFDVCAGLHQAFGGVRFSESQDCAFEHLHCGTYVDDVISRDGLGDLKAVHQAIYQEPAMARLLRPKQDQYFRERQTT